ncbi:hypothetical protein ACTXT7_010433 [Hymenolepis weldensis]
MLGRNFEIFFINKPPPGQSLPRFDSGRISGITLLSILSISGSFSAITTAENEAFKMMYPIYRLYFPQTRAYLTGSNNSNELVAQDRNPFRLSGESSTLIFEAEQCPNLAELSK